MRLALDVELLDAFKPAFNTLILINLDD